MIKNDLKLENLNLERAVIEVFGGCNYTCKMCPQSSPGREPSFKKKMSLDVFENILDQITPKYGHPLINLEGSGEPTLVKELPQYIEACTRRGLRSFIYCNGSHFRGDLMKDSLRAGLSLVRFSVIGYNRELYKKWMSKDNWDLIVENTSQAQGFNREKNEKKCSIESYHLILDPNRISFEVDQYQNNFIFPNQTQAYIWKQHNWSGNFKPSYSRKGKRRSCGRPASPEFTVRAGGINGEFAAATPCCQVLGPPSESQSVLGHFSKQSFEEIWMSPEYERLRTAHQEERFDDIDYCKNCDFLYEEEDVLVWTNDSNAQVGRPIGTELGMNS